MAVKTCSWIHVAFLGLTRGTFDEFCDLWEFHRGSFGNGKIKMNLKPVVTFPLIVCVVFLSIAGSARATIVPSDIVGLELWLDASDINNGGAQPADGSPVTTWMDKSGQNRDAVGGSGNTFDADGLDGFPTVAFDGGIESGFTSDPAPAVGTGNYALFMVFQTTNDKSWLFYNAFGDTGLRYGIAESSGDGTMGVNEQSFNIDHRADTSTLVNDDAVHFSLLHRAGNLGLTELGVDGVVLNNVTKNINLQTSLADNDINIARRFAGGNFTYSGDISEVLYYVGDFTAQDRDGINAYLNTKWSAIPEPSGVLLLVMGAAGLLVRRRPLEATAAH